MTNLTAAVAGAGFMGGTHIEALRRLGVQVAGCAGVSVEEGQQAMKRFGLPYTYEDFSALIADPAVDVVHICTPNYLHYPMVKAAMQAGKHVICEKPLAVNSKETAELVKLEQAHGVVGAVNYNLRFYPMCQDARSRIQAGEIGEVRIIHGHYLQDWLFYPTDWNWRLESDQGGSSRAVADIGTHWLDMVMWLTGLRVTAVMADLVTFLPRRLKPSQEIETFAGKLGASSAADEVPIHTEDYGSILLEFENGARGLLYVSQVSAGHKNQFRWEVDGTQASLSWAQETPNQMWVGYRDKANEVVTKDPALMRPESRTMANYPGGHAEGYPDTFKQSFRTVYSYIEAGNFTAPRNFPTLEEAHREIVLTEAIMQSSKNRRWVEIKY